MGESQSLEIASGVLTVETGLAGYGEGAKSHMSNNLDSKFLNKEWRMNAISIIFTWLFADYIKAKYSGIQFFVFRIRAGCLSHLAKGF